VPRVPSAHAGTPMGAPAVTSDGLTSHSAGVTTATRSCAECHLLAASCNTASIKTHVRKGEVVTAHAMKVYVGAGVQLQSYLTLALYGH
jgi:hypothetical protein